MDYSQLISKVDERIVKLMVVKDILKNAPKLNLDANILIKEITHINIEDLKKELEDC